MAKIMVEERGETHRETPCSLRRETSANNMLDINLLQNRLFYFNLSQYITATFYSFSTRV